MYVYISMHGHVVYSCMDLSLYYRHIHVYPKISGEPFSPHWVSIYIVTTLMYIPLCVARQ